MSKSQSLLNAGVASFALALGTFFGSAPAAAQSNVSSSSDGTTSQDTPDAPATTNPPSNQQATAKNSEDGSRSKDDGQTIVVTGTRIARPELESAMPISVLNMEDAKNFGYDTAYDALKLIPGIGPGLGDANSQGQKYDTGASNIDLRNMGVSRSLVLVDGKRWVSGGARASAVDLNTIPDAMIDRFEVVTGGAAAIYGADAVTGVVNVIMKKNIKGLRLTASTGISEQGDASATSLSAATGMKFAGGRGSFVVGGTYHDTAPLRWTDRYTNRISFVINPLSKGPDDGIPDNVLNDDLRVMNRAAIPSFFYKNQWYILRGDNLETFDYNYVNVEGELGYGNGGPGSTNFESHFLRNSSRKASVYSKVSYDLTPTITWSATFNYAHNDARGATVFPEVRDDYRPTSWWGIGTSGETATLDNPNLPDSLRQFMVANSLTSIPLDRTYLNLPQAYEYHRRDSFTVGTDAGGKLVGDLAWSGFLQYGQAVDHVTTTNMIRHIEWLYARDVVADPATGEPMCADATARANGCVPFNFFSVDRPSDAFLNYVEAERYERRKNALYNAGATISGSIFNLPYGAVSIALGAEWRRETLVTTDDPDTAKLADIVYGKGVDYILHPALDRSRNTAELYGEAVIPLLKDLPFARRLEIEGAYRYSHYSDNPETNTWKVGGTWEPVEGLTFRGVYSHSVRVPNFGELFSPQDHATLGLIHDPCAGVYITQNPNRATNCAALLPGVTLPIPFPNTFSPQVFTGGNPDLTPETSNSFTAGAVLQPRFLPGFDVTVDYWDIDITNVITSLSYLTILNNCVDSAAGIDNVYCNELITRDPTDGHVVSVFASNYNLAAQKARGIDVGANYRRQVGPGRFRLGFKGTYLIEQRIVGSPGATGVDYAGQWNRPRFRATLMTSYDIGKISVGLNTGFISRSVFSKSDASPETRDPNHVPAYVTNDVILTFRPTERYNLTFGVRNAGNARTYRTLQATSGVNTGAAYYGAIGRYFFVRAGVTL